MLRPPSIVNFERCYLGALAIGIVNTAVHWSRVQADPRVIQANELVGTWYTPAITGFGVLVPLLLWYFIARRASVVAKWIMVVLTGLGVLGALGAVLMGNAAGSLGALLQIVSTVLNVIAAVLLFRPNARAWFGEPEADIEEDMPA